MIATLEGKVSEKLSEIIVIDVNGVGYGLLVAAEDFAQLTVGDNNRLYVYEHVRENSHELFGFTKLEGKLLFELLLSVNGVGPKMALSLLNLGSTNDVRTALAGGDVKFIQAANGVGKRVAERLVVDLKDKVGLVGTDLAGTGLLQADSSLMKDDAIEALVALGFSPQDASKALQNVDPKLKTEERVKQALKQ